MDKIKYGQIGAGHAHSTGKIATFRASSEYEVVGVVESNPVIRAHAEQKLAYKDVRWMTEEQLLNTPGLKVVGVETEVKHLLEKAETCVNAGLHIHLDKPAGESLPRFKRILDTAARKHLLVQMGFMYRYNPAVIMMREFLQKGWLGDVFEIHTVMSKVISPGSRKKLAAYPGGMMFELGCHITDLVHGVLGTPDEIIGYRQHASKHDDNLVDNMMAVLRYPRALASVKTSAMEVNGFARRHFVVCGTEGTFHIQPLDSPSVRFSLSKAHGKYKRGFQQIALGAYPRYVGDVADMAKIIRNEKQADFSYEHDYQVQKTVLTASGLPLDK